MKIIKYQKQANGNYLIYFDNEQKIKLNEDVILKYKLLYKTDIDEYLMSKIIKENNNYDIYNKCVGYIGVRLRSINEMKEYMQRKEVSPEIIEETIDKLIKHKLLDDALFTQAFVNDKLHFTTMGPYRIRQELQKHKIDNNIIDKYIGNIDKQILEEKITKQITKLLKSNQNKPNLKNKIYHNLLNLGYSHELIITNLNKFDL